VVPVPESEASLACLHSALEEVVIEQQVLALPLRRAGAAACMHVDRGASSWRGIYRGDDDKLSSSIYIFSQDR
jgi:hypothetical protein